MLAALLLSLLAQAPCSQLGPVLSCPRPPPVNPWAYWTLNDASDGTFHDSGPNGLDLAVIQDDAGYPVRAAPWRAFTRRSTSGATSSQVSNYGENGVLSPATIASVQTATTFGFDFIRAPLDGGGGQDTIVALGCNSPPLNFDVISLSSYRSAVACTPDHLGLTWIQPDGGNVTTCFTGYTVSDGVQFHATVVLDPTSAGNFTPRLYVNGVFVESIAERPVPRWHTTTLDGGYVAISHRAHATALTGQVGGLLRNVAIYTRVLTTDEIRDLAAQ
jgi:hypothetical protein